MNKIVLSVFIALTMTTGARADIVMFSYTGGVQNFPVPGGVSLIKISAWGAEGRQNAGGVLGGLGGFATGILAVTPGQTLFVCVGGGGNISAMGGFNGGGNAGTSTSLLGVGGGGGGGASDVRVGGSSLSHRVIVAAGGGGAGGNRVSSTTGGRGTGGGGGGGYYGGGGGSAARLSGAAFIDGIPNVVFSLPTGGTQSNGGSGGISNATLAPSGNDGFAGTLGLGGDGGNDIMLNQLASTNALPGGGAGGGLIGLNGAVLVPVPPATSSLTGASGAGGSSFLGALTSASTMAGMSPMQMGNGFVQFEFTPVASVPEPSSLVLLILATLVTSCYVRFRGGSKPQNVVQRQ